jgi:release factor glutamine methyltransferase
MTIDDAIKGSAIARNEAEILLAHALKADRTAVLAHPERVLTDDEAQKITSLITRRRSGEPMGYVLGSVEFYGRIFNSDPRALIPRSPTESLVELAKEFLADPQERSKVIDTGIAGWSHPLRPELNIKTIVDIGTGAGCIAVTLALELPSVRIIGTDVSNDALSLAKENAELLGARVEWRQGNAFEPVTDLTEPFLLVSNPPYIPKDRSLAKEVSGFEPHVALFGGSDGMEVTRAILKAATDHPMCAGWILESEEAQKVELEKEYC